MRFTILRASATTTTDMVVVDNAVIDTVDCSALPANVKIVVYLEDEGKIEYTDRPAMRSRFTDPSPYQPFLNSWITAAAALTPSLQLAQAQQVKKDLVEAIFHHKRRLPFSFNGKVYDTRDEAVISMTATMVGSAGGDTSGLIGSINSALAALTSQVNGTVVGGANAMVTANNNSANSVNNWSYQNTLNWGATSIMATTLPGLYYLVANGPPIGGGSLAGGAGGGAITAGAGPGYGGFLTMSAVGNISGATVTAGGGNVPWQPVGSADPINIPGSEVSSALAGIVSRRNALNNNRVDKQAAIDALSTIPAVAAYDATTGWSS